MTRDALPSIRERLTRSLFWRMAFAVSVLSLLTLATLHALLARQHEQRLERRVAKISDIAVKAQRDGASLVERLAEYAPRRPGTRLVVKDGDGSIVYQDADLPAHTLSEHVRSAEFTRSLSTAPPLSFVITIDVAEDVQLARAMAGMLAAITAGAALLARWTGARAVRRGLAPIDLMGRALADVDPANLSYRLHLDQPPAELQPWIERFNTLMSRLEAAYRQLESFNADVAHELRTPLNNMIGQTEVALARPRTVLQLQETLSSNLEELHRLGHLVQDMLFLSRADRGAQARREEALSLAQLAHEVAEFHEAAAEERGLHVSVVGDALIAVDAGLMRRALSNLLSNAVRHALPNSVLRISIEVLELRPASEVSLRVENNGPDIATDHLPRLFDRFFRADSSRNATDVNHGLGLSIVAAIARMHGGRPVAQSRDGLTSIGFTIAAA